MFHVKHINEGMRTMCKIKYGGSFSVSYETLMILEIQRVQNFRHVSYETMLVKQTRSNIKNRRKFYLKHTNSLSNTGLWNSDF